MLLCLLEYFLDLFHFHFLFRWTKFFHLSEVFVRHGVNFLQDRLVLQVLESVWTLWAYDWTTHASDKVWNTFIALDISVHAECPGRAFKNHLTRHGKLHHKKLQNAEWLLRPGMIDLLAQCIKDDMMVRGWLLLITITSNCERRLSVKGKRSNNCWSKNLTQSLIKGN